MLRWGGGSPFRLEITMNILEAKLNSIPEDALGPAAPGATTAAAAAPGTPRSYLFRAIAYLC